jgi:glutathione synthase/RimK-type ligase-like ATP-grasp enzyme
MNNQKKILVIVGGNVNKIAGFEEAGRSLGLNLVTASFSELRFDNLNGKFNLRIGEHDASDFDVVYIRMVGKRLEDATILVNYAKAHNIKIVDRLYQEAYLMPLSLIKSMETMKLIENGISVPKTIFGRLSYIAEVGGEHLGFPFVIKSTVGRKAREVWSPTTEEDLAELCAKLSAQEGQGKRFFAQGFVAASQRTRVFVLGGKAIGAITRPTKWRKRFLEMENGGYPEGRKHALHPIPEEDAELAVKAAAAVGLDIAGVDIAQEDKSSKRYVWEVNAAPSWGAVAKDTGLNIEEEIAKFLSK